MNNQNKCFFCKIASADKDVSIKKHIYKYELAWNIKLVTSLSGGLSATAQLTSDIENASKHLEDEREILIPRCHACAECHFRSTSKEEDKVAILGEPYRAYLNAFKIKKEKQRDFESLLKNSKSINQKFLILGVIVFALFLFLLLSNINYSNWLAALTSVALTVVTSTIILSIFNKKKSAALRALPDAEASYHDSITQREVAEQTYKNIIVDWKRVGDEEQKETRIRRFPLKLYPAYLKSIFPGWSATQYENRIYNLKEFTFSHESVKTHLDSYCNKAYSLFGSTDIATESEFNMKSLLGEKKADCLYQLEFSMRQAMEQNPTYAAHNMEITIGVHAGAIRRILFEIHESINTLDLLPHLQKSMHEMIEEMDILTDYAEYGYPIIVND